MERGSGRTLKLAIVVLSMTLTAIACSQSNSVSRTLETSQRGRHAAAATSPLVIDLAAILGAHNRVRSEAGVAALEWSPDIAASPKRWADRLAATGSLEHGSGPYGENLWSGTAGAFEQVAMVESWASEKQHFVPGKIFPKGCRRHWSACGHYTQVVWRSTRRLGCGLARGRSTDVLVCRYDPPRNVVGEVPC